jgi:hypothetical protein
LPTLRKFPRYIRWARDGKGETNGEKKPETIVETSATKSGRRHSKVTGDWRNPSTEINASQRP